MASCGLTMLVTPMMLVTPIMLVTPTANKVKRDRAAVRAAVSQGYHNPHTRGRSG